MPPTALRAKPEFDSEPIEMGATTVLRLRDELDLLYATQVGADIELALTRGPRILAIDLRGLAFMDSSGVHAMIAAERRCRQLGARFFLIRGPAAIDRLMSICGMDRAFEVVNSPEQLPRDDRLLAIAV